MCREVVTSRAEHLMVNYPEVREPLTCLLPYINHGPKHLFIHHLYPQLLRELLTAFFLPLDLYMPTTSSNLQPPSQRKTAMLNDSFTSLNL